MVRSSKEEPKTPRLTLKSTEKDADTLALERSLTDVLGLNVEIDFDGSGGKLSVKYKTLDQLDDIIRRLSDSE